MNKLSFIILFASASLVFNYEIGTSYNFNYETTTEIKVSSNSNEPSTSHDFQAEILVEPISIQSNILSNKIKVKKKFQIKKFFS